VEENWTFALAGSKVLLSGIHAHYLLTSRFVNVPPVLFMVAGKPESRVDIPSNLSILPDFDAGHT
jgi:hypothetical protein